jgi:hypothetical protein
LAEQRAWDNQPGRLLRAAPDQRDASPSRALRDIVLDALVSLGVDGWVPYAAFERYVLEDPRIVGIERLLRRWAERLAITEPVPPEEIVRRVVLESLPVLGVVDLGSESEMALLAVNPELSASSNEEAAKRAVGRSTTLRLTQRGRVYLAGRTSSTTAEPSSFVDGQVLRVGGAALVAQVLSLAALSDIGRVEDTVDLVLSPAAITRAISAGALADEIRDRIEVLATPPDRWQVLTQASVVVGKASFVPASAFMWIEDPEIRELLRTRRATADLFVDPSPPSGLLVGAGVDLDRLVRKCRGLGVEIEVSNEGTMRAMTAAAPVAPLGAGQPPVAVSHRCRALPSCRRPAKGLRGAAPALRRHAAARRFRAPNSVHCGSSRGSADSIAHTQFGTTPTENALNTPVCRVGGSSRSSRSRSSWLSAVTRQGRCHCGGSRLDAGCAKLRRQRRLTEGRDARPERVRAAEGERRADVIPARTRRRWAASRRRQNGVLLAARPTPSRRPASRRASSCSSPARRRSRTSATSLPQARKRPA